MTDSRFPVAIGGIGSGTLLGAQILLDWGYALGADRNDAHDNLWFTLLFRRPLWQRTADENTIHAAIATFEALMCGTPLPDDASAIIDEAVQQMTTAGESSWGASEEWLLERLEAIEQRPSHEAALWGWKSPVTHIYLDALADYFPQMKCIHVIQHGLDMAYSENQQHVYHWGHLANVDATPDKPITPRQSVDWWLHNNKCAIQTGRDKLGDNFLLLNFDALCETPERILPELLSFLGVSINDAKLQSLLAMPKAPSSTGRFWNYALTNFRPKQLVETKRLGFPITRT